MAARSHASTTRITSTLIPTLTNVTLGPKDELSVVSYDGEHSNWQVWDDVFTETERTRCCRRRLWD